MGIQTAMVELAVPGRPAASPPSASSRRPGTWWHGVTACNLWPGPAGEIQGAVHPRVGPNTPHRCAGGGRRDRRV